MPEHQSRKLIAQRFSQDFATAVTILDCPILPLSSEQILVRNHFAGVNAGFDTLLCRGEVPYLQVDFPIDLGVEAVGEVVAVGLGVTSLKVGDAVATTVRGGGYRDYQMLDASLAIPIREVSTELLTLLPTGLSALVGLEQAGKMTREEVVLITAAAGGIGHIAVQLAKLAGNHVIGTCGSDQKVQFLERLGCDRIINYHHESMDQVLRDEYPNGVDLVFDCVGKQMFDVGVTHLATRGRFVVVGFIAEYGKPLEQVLAPRIYHELFWKAASIQGFLMPHFAEAIPEGRDRLLELYYSGKLQVLVDPTEFIGLESIPRAVQYLLRGQNCGKVVVRLDGEEV